MIRRSTVVVVLIALAMGLALFKLKYKMMFLEQQSHQIKKSIQENQEALHVLRAEWAYLNDPQRLQQLAEKYLDIKPLQSKQLILFAEIASENGKVYDKIALDKLITEAMNDCPQDMD